MIAVRDALRSGVAGILANIGIVLSGRLQNAAEEPDAWINLDATPEGETELDRAVLGHPSMRLWADGGAEFSGKLTAQTVDVSEGGGIALRPGEQYGDGSVSFRDGEAIMGGATMVSVDPGTPLRLFTAGGHPIEIAPAGEPGVVVDTSVTQQDNTAVLIRANKGGTTDVYRVKVDSSGYLYI